MVFVSRGNKGLTGEIVVSRGNKGVRGNLSKKCWTGVSNWEENREEWRVTSGE
jgi:hypothetical protein